MLIPSALQHVADGAGIDAGDGLLGQPDDQTLREAHVHHHPVHERAARPYREDHEIVHDLPRHADTVGGRDGRLDGCQVHLSLGDVDVVELPEGLDEVALSEDVARGEVLRRPDLQRLLQPTMERHLHLFGTIRGKPVDVQRGIFKAELIIEKPTIEVAREKLATPYLPAGNYLSHFGQHVFSPRIFESLEYLIKNNVREKGEIQLTAAQEHLRGATDKYWVAIVQGQRYDTGIPYGLMETQLALALNGIHRTEMCEAIARILTTQVKN